MIDSYFHKAHLSHLPTSLGPKGPLGLYWVASRDETKPFEKDSMCTWKQVEPQNSLGAVFPKAPRFRSPILNLSQNQSSNVIEKGKTLYHPHKAKHHTPNNRSIIKTTTTHTKQNNTTHTIFRKSPIDQPSCCRLQIAGMSSRNSLETTFRSFRGRKKSGDFSISKGKKCRRTAS